MGDGPEGSPEGTGSPGPGSGPRGAYWGQEGPKRGPGIPSFGNPPQFSFLRARARVRELIRGDGKGEIGDPLIPDLPSERGSRDPRGTPP